MDQILREISHFEGVYTKKKKMYSPCNSRFLHKVSLWEKLFFGPCASHDVVITGLATTLNWFRNQFNMVVLLPAPSADLKGSFYTIVIFRLFYTNENF